VLVGLFALALALSSLTACDRFTLLPAATPLPLPTELATTPLPPGSQLGGLDATFASVISTDGAQGKRCYRLYRFYPDGLALYVERACSTMPPGDNWAEINRWLNRDSGQVFRGDYHLRDGLIWVRIVSYDFVHEKVVFRQFQGETCAGEMVLQEPAATSAFAQPVLEYVRISPAAPSEDGDAVDCRVAGFKFLLRPTVALASGRVEFRIRTDPGETCELSFTNPDGSLSRAPGTGAVTADGQGVCRWEWEVGAQTGQGLVTIRIDQIAQDLALEIR
jgi:hypothetical protein